MTAGTREWYSGGLIIAEGIDVGKQKSSSKLQAKAKAAKLLEEVDQVAGARLLAAARRESGL